MTIKLRSITIIALLSTLIVLLLVGCMTKGEATQKPTLSIYEIDDRQIDRYSANANRYDLDKVEVKVGSQLRGKTIYWLGSSVTEGAGADHTSMVDYLAARTGAVCVKEAVSGTTLLDIGRDDGGSYSDRLINSENFDKTQTVDAFICQISTNDALDQNLEYRGEMSADDIIDMDSFDLTTTLGSVEFIIAYVTDVWHCPVYFYSGGYFGDTGIRSSVNPAGHNYEQLVQDVIKVAEKWNQIEGFDVEVIDLFNDTNFNSNVSDPYYDWCMLDAVHPKKAGYLQWWTPYFENFLSERLSSDISVDVTNGSSVSEIAREIMGAMDEQRNEGLEIPDSVDCFKDIYYGEDEQFQVLDVYRPKEYEGKLPVIVNVHGGSWVYGDKEVNQYYCMSLVENGFAVINFSYRLAPEYKYPSAIEDINLVMNWLLKTGDTYDIDTSNVFATGDSAGAHLLSIYSCILSNTDYAETYDIEVPKGISFQAIALNCGKYDMDYIYDNDVNLMYIMSDLLIDGGTREELAWITPFHYMSSEFPPTYLMSAIGDVYREEADKMESYLANNNIPYVKKIYGTNEEPLSHVFHLDIKMQEAQSCNEDECSFFISYMD